MPDVRTQNTENVALYNEEGQEIGSQQLARLTEVRDQLTDLLPPGGASGGTATEPTQVEVRDAVTAAVARLEAIRDRIPAAGAGSEATLAGLRADLAGRDLASGANLVALRDALVAAIGGASDEAAVAAVDALRTTFTGRDLASVASVDAARDAIVAAVAAASDEAVVAAVDALRTHISGRDLATGARQDTTIARLEEVRNRLPVSGAATEVTAAGIRSDLGAEGAGAAAIPGSGVRGWLRSIFDRLADGSSRFVLHNSHGQIANPFAVDEQFKSVARLSDSARIASTGRLALTLSGNIRGIISNPATLDGGAPNATSIRLERVEVYTSVAGGFASVLTNVTGGVPTTPRRPKVNPRTLAQTTASIAGQPVIVVGDATSTNFSGGNDTGIVVPLAGDTTIAMDTPFTLAPGQNLALQAAFAKGVDAIITFFWSNV